MMEYRAVSAWELKTISDGAVIDLHEPTTLEIDGIGRLEVDPGPSTDIDDVAAALEKHRATLAGHLTAAGVRDVAEARTGLYRRQEFDVERISINARLNAVAPNGIDRLRSDMSEARRKLDGIIEHLGGEALNSNLSIANGRDQWSGSDW